MPTFGITYGPQHPGWDPFREQEQAREHRQFERAVTTSEAVTAEDGDLSEDIWLELQSETAAIAAQVPPLRFGPQHPTWDPRREQDILREHLIFERAVEAAQAVADEDGDETDETWRDFAVEIEEIARDVGRAIRLFPT